MSGEVERPGIEGKVVERPCPPLWIHTGIPWPEEELRRRGLLIAGKPRPVILGEVESSRPEPSPHAGHEQGVEQDRDEQARKHGQEPV